MMPKTRLLSAADGGLGVPHDHPFANAAGLLCLFGAIAGVIGGIVTGFIPAAVSTHRYSYPYTPAGFRVAEMVFILNHVLLGIGLLGLGRSGATGAGRRGLIGMWVSVAGMAVLTVCEVRAFTLATSRYPSPNTDTLDIGFGVATILIGIGLVLAGVAVVAARQWPGWRRWVPLTCGIAVFVMVIPGLFATFLAGRIVLTVWMAMFAGLGWAICSPVDKPQTVEDTNRTLQATNPNGSSGSTGDPNLVAAR